MAIIIDKVHILCTLPLAQRKRVYHEILFITRDVPTSQGYYALEDDNSHKVYVIVPLMTCPDC